VAGWRGLKTESGDVANLMSHIGDLLQALKTMPFQKGENDEDIPLRIGTRMIYNIYCLSLRLCHQFVFESLLFLVRSCYGQIRYFYFIFWFRPIQPTNFLAAYIRSLG
jgi:hypothetical protein